MSGVKVSNKGAGISKIVRKGTLLVSFKLTLGRLAFAGRELFTNEAIAALTIFDEQELSKEFLFYFLNFFDWIKAAENDVKLKGMTLNKSKLKELHVLFPSPPEQQRIVAILDEAFEGIAKAKANAEQNLLNARALFESHLNDVFSQKGEGWEEERLGELSRINYGYTESACAESVGPKFLRITDIQNNHVNWNTVPYCPIKNSNIPKYKLKKGDIVFARTGATTGKSYLISKPPCAVFASYLIRVQLNSLEILPSFLFLFFQTAFYWDTIKSGSAGSAQGGFNANKLKKLRIPYPKRAQEQQSIIAKFNVLAAETRRLETIYRQKCAALDELKKSLLYEAFSGNL
ncbi:restriction endonuclease subunit S [Chlamydiales bacterium]|nr:restriction endonuclease subunit S [Chlamydiales bacterium]